MDLPKQITIPLSEYLDDKLEIRERAQIKEERAKQILLIDPEEDLCHITFPGVESGSYVIWRIKAWRDSEKKRAADKITSEKNRKEWTVFKENIRLVVNHLWLLSGIDKPDLVKQAYKMLRKNTKQLLLCDIAIKQPYVPTDLSTVVSIEFEGRNIKL